MLQRKANRHCDNLCTLEVVAAAEVSEALLAEMLSDTEQLTRALLGSTSEGEGMPAPPDAGHWHLRAGPGMAP